MSDSRNTHIVYYTSHLATQCNTSVIVWNAHTSKICPEYVITNVIYKLPGSPDGGGLDTARIWAQYLGHGPLHHDFLGHDAEHGGQVLHKWLLVGAHRSIHVHPVGKRIVRTWKKEDGDDKWKKKERADLYVYSLFYLITCSIYGGINITFFPEL